MSEEIKAPEGEEKSATDLDKYVPKEDFEKLSNSSKSEIEKLKTELDNAKLSLLDPEYVEYMESKHKKGKLASGKSEENLEDTSSPKLQDMEGRLNKLQHTLSDVLAVLELKEVEAKYSDFGKFRDNTKEVLESSSTPLTIEQAYLIAKQKFKAEKSDEDKEEEAKLGGEKPGGSLPKEALTPKSFKSNRAAAEDAWNSIIGAGRDTF